jgi:hypothetical protein
MVVATCTFTHEKGKISKVLMEEHAIGDGKRLEKMSKSLRFLLPGQASETMLKYSNRHKNQKAQRIIYSITYTWKGDNVEKEVNEYTDPTGKVYIDTYTYTYDKKKNPFYGLFDGGEGTGVQVQHLSKNNITAVTYTYSGDDNNLVEYSDSYDYVYKDNFPTQFISTEVFDVEMSETTVKATRTYTTFYEYK